MKSPVFSLWTTNPPSLLLWGKSIGYVLEKIEPELNALNQSLCFILHLVVCYVAQASELEMFRYIIENNRAR